MGLDQREDGLPKAPLKRIRKRSNQRGEKDIRKANVRLHSAWTQGA